MKQRQRRRPSHLFKKGQSGNPKGRPKGAKSRITDVKVELIARTGMTPIDFLTAVYRDELYDKYVTELLADGRTQMWKPAPGAKRIPCGLPQRIVAASNAAPYVHKRQPIGVEVTDKNQRLITAQKLAQLPPEQLEALLNVLDRLSEGAEARLLEAAPRLVASVPAGEARV